MVTVEIGEKVRYYSHNGIHTGTIIAVEYPNGCPYATIKPDDSEGCKYLNYGAVEGFEKLDDNLHPWSPLMIARYRMMRLT